jgi:hypothetical protein
MSIAKLTAQSLSDMTSRKDAPRIYATVLRKPNFANTDGFPGGDAVIPQVCRNLTLASTAFEPTVAVVG